MIDLDKEREAFESAYQHHSFIKTVYRDGNYYSVMPSLNISKDEKKLIVSIANSSWNSWQRCKLRAQEEINDLKQQLAEVHKSRVSWVEYSQKIESGEFVLVPKLPARKGGYYIQDKRSYLGNCMFFWLTHGYGTKHSKFHWFETLEQAQQRVGGATWFEIWYAPYIDSLIESTIDCQYVNRDQEKAMIEALEKKHD